MAEQRARVIDGLKFMWDNRDYETEGEAEEVRKEYGKERFESRIVQEDGKFHVYTRRVVKEVVVDGTPPT